MREEVLFTLDTPYRQPLAVKGWYFGTPGRKTLAVMGALRGNEVQQMYVCSQLIRRLAALEQEGALSEECGILVIPCANQFSMNVGRRFWAADNTDINRMFPGYDAGETTQRIAARIFAALQGYTYGIHMASLYLPGHCLPHLRIMKTGYQTPETARDFGLPYIALRDPHPYDTTTLNYNWQIWNTNAFSLYTTETDFIDEVSARQAVAAVLRFLTRMGILKYHSHSGFISTIINEADLTSVRSNAGGIYRRLCRPGDEVPMGMPLAEIVHPYEGNVISTILSPTEGIIFFTHKKPLVTENEVICKIIRRLHA